MLCVIDALGQITWIQNFGYYSGKYIIFNTHWQGGLKAWFIHMDERQQHYSLLSVMLILHLRQNIVWRDRVYLDILQSFVLVHSMDTSCWLDQGTHFTARKICQWAYYHSFHWLYYTLTQLRHQLRDDDLWGWVPFVQGIVFIVTMDMVLCPD